MYINIFTEEDKHYNIVHYTTIVLAISTCGTSVLLWWLYKALVKCFSGKDKYDIEGTYIHVHMCSYL